MTHGTSVWRRGSAHASLTPRPDDERAVDDFTHLGNVKLLLSAVSL
jgi:hypothetical protein